MAEKETKRERFIRVLDLVLLERCSVKNTDFLFKHLAGNVGIKCNDYIGAAVIVKIAERDLRVGNSSAVGIAEGTLPEVDSANVLDGERVIYVSSVDDSANGLWIVVAVFEDSSIILGEDGVIRIILKRRFVR